MLADAFASCSSARGVALAFAQSASGADGSVLFTIRRDPQRMTAADVSTYSAFPDEHEVLLIPGLRFRVLALHARRDQGFTEVILQEMADYPNEL